MDLCLEIKFDVRRFDSFNSSFDLDVNVSL